MDYAKEAVKQALKDSMTFEGLFDERSAVPLGTETLKEDLIVKIMASGKKLTVEDHGEGVPSFTVKVLDQHTSMMYNVFENQKDYDGWFEKQLHEFSPASEFSVKIG